ncbi:GGDEF domain-containing protein [Pantoea sp. DY-15]|uniref:GGDEF domain-containing protein n=1 Tax=unclassified Pantoea TaxID=2630326 RepID=UPI001C955C05|nr:MULTISPECIES: GGDEF domain-containing protein [unclassified Pantoea]MBY4841318.1 GGDEF domain-containing protein [Pantoea sp. DY-5]MBY4888539.1 GGDEF domain-containing protein [Pantoea sp. DY-15]
MNFKIHDKLIHEVESPKGLLYRMVITYTCFMATLIIVLSFAIGDTSKINFYFFINSCTVAVMAWFIRKSFNIQSTEVNLLVFRVSLFLLLNSSLASMAGGLGLIERDTASLIASIIYIPAILMIIFLFEKFIFYVNHNYKSAVNLSLTDELTGLPNRRHLNVILRGLENRSGTICIADIDHFKKINDTYGHEAGDRVLRDTGLRLSNLVSENVFIARSGGEEFAIVIYDNINAEDIIRKIKTSVSDACNGSFGITLSIGVATKLKHDSSSSAINAADDALYRAKRAGRDCIIYDQSFKNN